MHITKITKFFIAAVGIMMLSAPVSMAQTDLNDSNALFGDFGDMNNTPYGDTRGGGSTTEEECRKLLNTYDNLYITFTKYVDPSTGQCLHTQKYGNNDFAFKTCKDKRQAVADIITEYRDKGCMKILGPGPDYPPQVKQ